MEPAPARAASSLDPLTRDSIQLAVAQWLGSARATSAARESLRAAGIAPDEIERRRRAQSSDRRLAATLRLAVTLVIARGRLSRRDRAALDPDQPTLRAIVIAVSDAFARTLLAETVDATPYPAIEMRLEDY
jgi:alkylhydroperoxidase family enzyme